MSRPPEKVKRDLSKSWIEDDAFFIDQCLIGEEWEDFVINRLNQYGINDIVQHKKGFKTSKAELKHYREKELDLKIYGHYFEVKSRDMKFTCAGDFPFKTVFIEDTVGFDAKVIKPLGYIFVSQYTGAMIGVASKTKATWSIATDVYDRKRHTSYDYYCADKNLIMSEARLVECIRQLKPK